MTDDNVLQKVFTCMMFNRKYSAGFISHRQKIGIASVRNALRVLHSNNMLTMEVSTADKRRKLYKSNQRSLKLW